MAIHSINEAHSAVQARTTKAVEVADFIIARHSEKNYLNAFCRFNPVQIHADASACDKRLEAGEQLPLAGLFLAVKDCIDVRDLPTGDGTAALQKNVAAANNQGLQRLLDMGATVVGKMNLHELGFGITSNNAFSGPVRNPFNPDMITGGSSGGTASAIGAGIVAAGLGTDTGGSCRIPASLCNCYGYRPSMMRYPAGGAVNICNTRDTIGPLAASMDTLLLMDAVMSGGKGVDLPHRPTSSIRLGIDPKIHIDEADAAIRETVIDALARLKAAGVAVIEIDISGYMSLVGPISFPLVFFETKRELTAYLAGIGLTPKDLCDGISSPDVRAIFEGPVFGKEAPSDEVYAHIMTVLRPNLIAAHKRLLEQNNLDGLVFPTTPLPARPIGHDETVELNGRQVPTFLTYVQNCDLCTNIGGAGLTMPIGFTKDGLPIGLEVDGHVGDDRNLLAVARAVDRILNR